MDIQQILRKYFIMGSQNCPAEKKPEAILQEALEAGITAFQFREKGKAALVGEEKVALGKRLRNLCAQYDVPFIINDDVDLVETLEVDGIHVGQDDQAVERIREQFPNIIIGLSISHAEELASSNLKVVDYIGAGPIFTTKTKTDAKAAVGLEWIETLRKVEPHMPIVGIGGINEENAAQVMAAGADGLSVISAITQSKDIAATVAAL